MNDWIFDLHCDTALELIDREGTPRASLRANQGHIDLTRGSALDGYCQCFALFTTTGMDRDGKLTDEQVFDAMRGNLLRQMEEHGDLVEQVKATGDMERIVGSGKVAAILTIEGTAGIGFDPERLYALRDQGFLMTTLGWNEKNPLAGSHKTGGGLTDLGREYVRVAQSLGMVMDVSHLSEQAFWNLMDVTNGPVCASHSNARVCRGVSRNLTDEQFGAICASGGVAGLNLYTDFLGEENVTVETACDHVLHWLDLGGGKHIALGGDLDGCDPLPEGFSGVESYPKLITALRNRGVDDQTISDLCWNNAWRVMEDALRHNIK